MEKLSNNELSAQAYKEVRSMIINKKLVPGQKIVQDKLAENLGISRTPLRSALQMLEGEGLIESVPRKGVIVKEFTDREIVEIFDCRIALEVTAIRLFTDRASDAEINELRNLFLPFLNGKIDNDAYQKADAKFHDAIMLGSGNNFLHKLFHKGNLLVCIDLIGLLRQPDETLQEHMEMIDAIQKRDSDLAEELSKSHLDRTKQLILKKLNE
ncbi:GntR family transcriptional regulator [Aquimarina sp. AU119]|uniref:GntR family transcriptional regulator n=1 Tax=Aquimarina sp. AU119 TaxID=2108528 RepID=UPI000D696E54|nr:GntR family transcriptional regulator [Aquimarina sp. AU119]